MNAEFKMLDLIKGYIEVVARFRVTGIHETPWLSEISLERRKTPSRATLTRIDTFVQT
jgi:hypothetical protein